MKCGLCDMARATKVRIPACKRPAKHWIKLESGIRFYMCEYHWKKEMSPLERTLRLLDLWIHPMLIKCLAPGHNGGVTQSCSCRQNELERRTKALLRELRASRP